MCTEFDIYQLLHQPIPTTFQQFNRTNGYKDSKVLDIEKEKYRTGILMAQRLMIYSFRKMNQSLPEKSQVSVSASR